MTTQTALQHFYKATCDRLESNFHDNQH